MHCEFSLVAGIWKCARCGRSVKDRTGNPPHAKCKTRKLPCARLGNEVRRQECPTCSGTVKIKVFACAVHGECTTAKALPALACCKVCSDYCAGETQVPKPPTT